MNIDTIVGISDQTLSGSFFVNHRLVAANSENWLPYPKFLYGVVQHYSLSCCVELGVYMGLSTFYLAAANSSGTVVAVDIEPHKRFYEVSAGFPNIAFVKGTSYSPATVEAVADIIFPSGIQLLFIDSLHDGITPRREFEAYSPYFADECIVCCDDIYGPFEQTREAMQEFWHWLPGEKVELNKLHPAYASVPMPGFGVSIVRRGDK